MTWRILKLSAAAALGMALLFGSRAAGAESRPAAKPPQAEAKIPHNAAKPLPDTAKTPSPAPEAAPKAHGDGICIGRLMELMRQRIAA